MASALDGVRVIDFGQYIAGPLAAMFLADHGADVIHVDPPGGPRWDTPANASWHRGKRSILLDLKREDDRNIAQRLIASADVVVEEAAVFYQLNITAMGEIEAAHPEVAARFHAMVVKAVADRLEFSNAMVAALQR